MLVEALDMLQIPLGDQGCISQDELAKRRLSFCEYHGGSLHVTFL